MQRSEDETLIVHAVVQLRDLIIASADVPPLVSMLAYRSVVTITYVMLQFCILHLLSRIISRKCGYNIDVILLMCCVSRRGDALGATFQTQCFTSNSNIRKRLFTKRHRRRDVVSLLIPPSLYLRFIFKCI